MSQKHTQKNLFVKNSAKMLIFAIVVFGSIALSPKSSSAFVSDISRSNIISLTNIERTGNDLPRLSENETLNVAAQLKLDHMLKNDYFAHNAPDGTTPWHWFEITQYDYQHAGENLAMDFDYVANQHKAWMNSTTHRQNIMSSKYTQIGVATGVGHIDGDLTTVTVQIFGTPIGVAPVKGVSTQSQNLSEQTAMAPVPTAFQEKLNAPTSSSFTPQSATQKQKESPATFPFDSKTVGYIAWAIIITATLLALTVDSVLLYRIHMKQREEKEIIDAPPAQI